MNKIDYRTLTFKELDQRTIRTGCETEDNRRADMEMHRRGYKLSPQNQMWLCVSCGREAGEPHRGSCLEGETPANLTGLPDPIIGWREKVAELEAEVTRLRTEMQRLKGSSSASSPTPQEEGK